MISMKTGRRNEGQFLIRVSFELATSLKVLRNLKVVRRASHFHHVSPILSRAVGADFCIAVEKPRKTSLLSTAIKQTWLS